MLTSLYYILNLPEISTFYIKKPLDQRLLHWFSNILKRNDIIDKISKCIIIIHNSQHFYSKRTDISFQNVYSIQIKCINDVSFFLECKLNNGLILYTPRLHISLKF